MEKVDFQTVFNSTVHFPTAILVLDLVFLLELKLYDQVWMSIHVCHVILCFKRPNKGQSFVKIKPGKRNYM